MMKAGTETGSLINHLYSRAAQIKPQVGMGATILCWTDRHAGTIIEVTADSFVVQEDRATRTDKNGMSDCQSYSYEPDPNGPRTTFKRVKRGKAKGDWRENGVKDGRGVLIGRRDKHHDYSF
jgi:hypothetical protein